MKGTVAEELSADDVLALLMGSPQPADPYPLYERLRRVAPVCPGPLGIRFLSRYDDCVVALRSPSFRMAGPDLARADPRFPTSAFLQSQGDWLIFKDPPAHTRLRSLVMRAFTPRVIQRLRPRIQGLVDGYIQHLERLPDFDFVAEVANTLPSEVVCELVGVPSEDHASVAAWTDHIALATTTPYATDTMLKAADSAVEEFQAYLDRLVAQRRAEPQDDLLSALLAAEEAGTFLTTSELEDFVIQLLGAGVETTKNLLTLGVMAFLLHPHQAAAVCGNPSLMPSAVEEILRFEPPVHMAFPRLATEETVIGEETIRPGEMVAALLGSANHDPSAFEDPTEFKVDRVGGKAPLAFGSGIHFCIGAALARAEGEITLLSLLTRLPGLRLADQTLQWRDSFMLRGVHRLELSNG